MNKDIKIIENAINNNAPNIEWGFNDKLKKNYNINNILFNIIIFLLCWSIAGIIIAMNKNKNKILSILFGPIILFR
jgi:hypothetical protein